MSEGCGALQEHSEFGIGTVSLDLVALQEHSEFGRCTLCFYGFRAEEEEEERVEFWVCF